MSQAMPTRRPPRIVLDRFEGDFAVLEVEGHFVDFPRSALPPGAHEGAFLVLQAESGAEEASLKRARARLQRLSERDPGGDIAL